VVFSIAGLGGLAGTLASPWVRTRVRIGWLLVGGIFVWTAGMAAVAAAPNLVVMTVAWLLMPAVSGLNDVATVSYRLSLIPAEMQGRVNSVFRLLAWGLNPVSLAIGGVLVAAIGPRDTLWLIAAGIGATAVSALFDPIRLAR